MKLLIIIWVLVYLLVAAGWSAYGQGVIIGGKVNLGGEPSSALILSPANCAVNSHTNVNDIHMGVNAVGADRMLLAVAFYNGTPTVTSVSTETQSFTLVGTANAEGQVQASFWRLINPVLGTQTVHAQLSAEVGALHICVLAFENINQGIGTQNFAQTVGTSGPAALSTSSAAGNLAIVAFVSANNFIDPYDDSYVHAANPGAIIVAFVGKKPGAGTVNVSYSLTGGNAWGLAMVDVVKN